MRAMRRLADGALDLQSVDTLTDFDSAYAAEDWSRWSGLPAFEAANRANAWNIYLQIEQETLHGNADALP